MDELQLARRSGPEAASTREIELAGACDIDIAGAIDKDARRGSAVGGSSDQPKTATKAAFSEGSASTSSPCAV